MNSLFGFIFVGGISLWVVSLVTGVAFGHPIISASLAAAAAVAVIMAEARENWKQYGYTVVGLIGATLTVGSVIAAISFLALPDPTPNWVKIVSTTISLIPLVVYGVSLLAADPQGRKSVWDQLLNGREDDRDYPL